MNLPTQRCSTQTFFAASSWGERLCFFSSGLRDYFWIPVGSSADHRIENDEQFSHTRCEHDFEGFSGLLETIGELTNDRVVFASTEGCHVQDSSNAWAASPDGTFSSHHSTVPIEGRQSDE